MQLRRPPWVETLCDGLGGVPVKPACAGRRAVVSVVHLLAGFLKSLQKAKAFPDGLCPTRSSVTT